MLSQRPKIREIFCWAGRWDPVLMRNWNKIREEFQECFKVCKRPEETMLASSLRATVPIKWDRGVTWVWPTSYFTGRWAFHLEDKGIAIQIGNQAAFLTAMAINHCNRLTEGSSKFSVTWSLSERYALVHPEVIKLNDLCLGSVGECVSPSQESLSEAVQPPLCQEIRRDVKSQTKCFDFLEREGLTPDNFLV